MKKNTISLFLHRVNSLYHEDTISGKIRKFNPLTGMGFFPVMIAGGSLACPAAALAGFVVTLGSIALHEYSARRSEKIHRDYNPMKVQCEQAA